MAANGVDVQNKYKNKNKNKKIAKEDRKQWSWKAGSQYKIRLSYNYYC